MKRKRRFLLPAQELLFTERRSLRTWDILTKNILHIWRTWTWDTGPESTDMKTGMHLMPWYTMWEAVPSGSRYNQFKIRYSSRNNIYLIYKNMPVLQIIINLPFLVAGFGIKILFFTVKGFGREYTAGIKNGFYISMKNKKYLFRFQTSAKLLQNSAGTVDEHHPPVCA